MVDTKKRKRTPNVKWPSECRKIADLELRKRAYRRAVYVNKRWQDSLETRISAAVPIDPCDVAALVNLLGHRCREETKELLRARLENVDALPSFGIFGRVMLDDHGPSYCAGQDYPSEIATVRRLILHGK